MDVLEEAVSSVWSPVPYFPGIEGADLVSTGVDAVGRFLFLGAVLALIKLAIPPARAHADDGNPAMLWVVIAVTLAVAVLFAGLVAVTVIP